MKLNLQDKLWLSRLSREGLIDCCLGLGLVGWGVVNISDLVRVLNRFAVYCYNDQIDDVTSTYNENYYVF